MKASKRDNLIGSLCAAAVLAGGIILAILLFA
jgi:hypothetical protein